jgi:hypothetical protein
MRSSHPAFRVVKDVTNCNEGKILVTQSLLAGRCLLFGDVSLVVPKLITFGEKYKDLRKDILKDLLRLPGSTSARGEARLF